MVDRRLRSVMGNDHPKELAEACQYVLTAGGKRVRSVLVLLASEAVGGKAARALDAAAAVEILHNFTLVHDDIMDNAPTRRGRPTVHRKWNLNNALLAGDLLLGLAYRYMLRTRSLHLDRALKVLTEAFIAVCDGQALDLEFERRSDVTVNEYFRMIARKTGALIAAATEIGAIIGGGTEREIAALRKFGALIGRAFQLQDDLLDVVGKERDFGKTIGGDILEGKKTFLLLNALEHSSGRDRAALMRVMKRRYMPPLRTRTERTKEVRTIATIYAASGAIETARQHIRKDTEQAVAALESLPESSARSTLVWLSQMLVKRSF